MRSIILTLPIAATLIGCGSIGSPIRDVQRELGVDDVKGRWVMNEKSLTMLKRKGHEPRTDPYTIVFKSDGTLMFDSIIDGLSKPLRVTDTGNWSLKHDTTGYSNQKYHNLILMSLPQQRFSFQFDEIDGKLILWQTFGDPDMWEFLEYQRDN